MGPLGLSSYLWFASGEQVKDSIWQEETGLNTQWKRSSLQPFRRVFWYILPAGYAITVGPFYLLKLHSLHPQQYLWI